MYFNPDSHDKKPFDMFENQKKESHPVWSFLLAVLILLVARFCMVATGVKFIHIPVIDPQLTKLFVLIRPYLEQL